MKTDLKLITVVTPNATDTQLYQLAEQAIVTIWEKDGYTLCKDVLGNTWLVISAGE